MEVLDLTSSPDTAKAARVLRLSMDKAQDLAERAAPLIRPRALVLEAFIEEKTEAAVRINGIEFHSRVLAENLRDVQRVFPFILTIGGDLEKTAASAGDLLLQYQLEAIGDLALMAAGAELEDYLKKYGLAKAASLSPGSLEDWPITEQPKLFALLDGGESVGVRLSESMLMIPRKSLSGIYFPTKIDFQSCRLCPRADCSGRRAAYDPVLRKAFGLEKPGPR
jgi:hypothetical protein